MITRKLNRQFVLMALAFCCIPFIGFVQEQGNSSYFGKAQIVQPEEENNSFLASKRIPWEKNELVAPKTVANELENNQLKETLILNIGSQGDIKNAINFGAVAGADNMNKLKTYLAKVPKNKAILIYCGCCPTDVCANVKAAYKTLQSNGFTNFEIINLTSNLKKDWVDKGYPMKE